MQSVRRRGWRRLFATIVGALLVGTPLAPHVVAAQNGAGTSSPADERARADQADIQERGVGGLRSDTTGQSDYTDYSMGVDIPPGAGGSRSDMSGQPDYTDNHMGVDTPPGRGGY